MAGDIEVRPATASDLDGVHALAASYGNLSHWPERPDYLDHELAAGILMVAVEEGEVLGFAGVLERGDLAFLADLFVRRDLVGKGIGRSLLDAAFQAGSASARATCASADPRAVPLYESFGMRPIAPLHYLSGGRAPALGVLAGERSGDALQAMAPDDPVVVDLDARTGPRRRAVDLSFIAGAGAVAMVAREDGSPVGAAIVRISPVTGSALAREAFVSPSFAISDGGARRVMSEAVREAATRADAVHATVPGPHPALGPLLEAGLRIVDQDTVMATRADLFDLTRCVPSPELG